MTESESTIPPRVCRTCGTEKPLTEFSKNGTRPMPDCRPCYNANKRLKYAANITQERERKHRQYARNRDLMRERSLNQYHSNPEWARERRRNNYHNNLETYRERARKKSKEHPKTSTNPFKDSARWKLHEAVKRGDILKPTACQECRSSERRIEGHHADYSKPYDVEWLCPFCHGKRHRKGPHRGVGE